MPKDLEPQVEYDGVRRVRPLGNFSDLTGEQQQLLCKVYRTSFESRSYPDSSLRPANPDLLAFKDPMLDTYGQEDRRAAATEAVRAARNANIPSNLITRALGAANDDCIRSLGKAPKDDAAFIESMAEKAVVGRG